MPFSSYQPSGPAAAFIESYWLVDDPDATPREQKIIPDGFPEIIFHYGDPYCIQLKSDWQLQSKRLLAGQVKQYFFLKNTGTSGVLGIKCKPAAITALFGLNMSDYTDKVADLYVALGHRLDEVEKIACAALPPEEKARVRPAKTSAQKVATGAGIAPPPAAPTGSFFASSLLICSSVEPFCVAVTRDRTAELSGALDKREKFAGPAEEGRSE